MHFVPESRRCHGFICSSSSDTNRIFEAVACSFEAKLFNFSESHCSQHLVPVLERFVREREREGIGNVGRLTRIHPVCYPTHGEGNKRVREREFESELHNCAICSMHAVCMMAARLERTSFITKAFQMARSVWKAEVHLYFLHVLLAAHFCMCVQNV